ncbi:hypothetical protein EYF80_039139 [Liparis tanakae]|uniref:Uncharacterized protein n=1 Tax=Liparis tanakae TaxID=230148 RepID=A0A4Z2GBE2_9TELE|nr:hypothetical protein EYF80_039139 [Liparis tanakae]
MENQISSDCGVEEHIAKENQRIQEERLLHNVLGECGKKSSCFSDIAETYPLPPCNFRPEKLLRQQERRAAAGASWRGREPRAARSTAGRLWPSHTGGLGATQRKPPTFQPSPVPVVLSAHHYYFDRPRTLWHREARAAATGLGSLCQLVPELSDSAARSHVRHGGPSEVT